MSEDKGNDIVRGAAILGLTGGLGVIAGALYSGFGHLRHIYSSKPKKKERELKRLEKENVEKLKARLIIGAVLGGVAGVALGIVLAPCSEEQETTEED